MRLLAFFVLRNHWHLVLWLREGGDLSDFPGWLTNTHRRRWHLAHGTLGRRELDTRRRTLQRRLTRKRAKYAAQTLHPEADKKEIEQWQKRQAALVEAIQHLEYELSEVKQLQSQTTQARRSGPATAFRR